MDYEFSDIDNMLSVSESERRPMPTPETVAAPRNTEEQLVRHCCAELAEFDAHFYRPAHTIRMGSDDVQWRFCPWCGKPLPNIKSYDKDCEFKE